MDAGNLVLSAWLGVSGLDKDGVEVVLEGDEMCAEWFWICSKVSSGIGIYQAFDMTK
jgi:hypothetical protein